MKTPLLSALALFATAALAAAAEPAAKPHCSRCAAPIPAVAPISDRSLYQLDAAWQTDAGQAVTLTSLRGRPVVVAMFFASCTYACPVLVSDLQRIREALPPEVRAKAAFVLVSFDTQRDTPAALHAYRERLGLDASWALLHGSAEDVQELAMLLGVKYKQDANGNFSHSNLITVLNAGGEIVHQRTGLQGDVAEMVRAITEATR